MSDTPRTDDSETRVRKNGLSSLIEYCYANDMAKLERELTAARAEIEAIMETLKSPIEVELDMIRGKIAIPDRAELDCIAQIKEVTEQRDKAWRKIENQAERITYLEGATNHATGTPLSKAIEQRDRLADAALFLVDVAEKNTDDGDLWRSAIDNVRNLAGMTEKKYIKTN